MITFPIRTKALLLWKAKVCGEQPGLAATVSRDPGSRGILLASNQAGNMVTYKIELSSRSAIFNCFSNTLVEKVHKLLRQNFETKVRKS